MPLYVSSFYDFFHLALIFILFLFSSLSVLFWVYDTMKFFFLCMEFKCLKLFKVSDFFSLLIL